MQLVAEWFGRTAGLDWNSLTAEDCARVLLMLPLTNVELREDLFARLTLAFRAVALPGIVARVTQRAFDQLKSDARVDEAQARFEELRRKSRATDWEVYFRELEAFVGVDRRLAHHDHVPLPERVDTYLLLVSEFARVELERGSNMTWRMMYEPAILMPLAKLSVHDVYRDCAMTTYNAVLDAMEAPVRQDLEPRQRQPVRTRRETEQAARLFLIEAFRRGPYFEQMEHGVYVRLTTLDDTVELMSQAEEAWIPRTTPGPASTYFEFAAGRTISLSGMKRRLWSLPRRTNVSSRRRAGRTAADTQHPLNGRRGQVRRGTSAILITTVASAYLWALSQNGSHRSP